MLPMSKMSAVKTGYYLVCVFVTSICTVLSTIRPFSIETEERGN